VSRRALRRPCVTSASRDPAARSIDTRRVVPLMQSRRLGGAGSPQIDRPGVLAQIRQRSGTRSSRPMSFGLFPAAGHGVFRDEPDRALMVIREFVRPSTEPLAD
jgi:hypothetical protein